MQAGPTPWTGEDLGNAMTVTAMPVDKFWQIIARAARSDHDPEAHKEALHTTLRELPLEEIIAFEMAFERHRNDAYTFDLLGAAYVIHSGCSNDAFDDFVSWLISRGRKVYEAALADPDSLALLDARLGPHGEWQFEEIAYVAGQVFEEKGGEGHVMDHFDVVAPMFGSWSPGEPFEEDNAEHLARRYPKLWQRFKTTPQFPTN
jgi:uncharacterized protein DUF4240